MPYAPPIAKQTSSRDMDNFKTVLQTVAIDSITDGSLVSELLDMVPMARVAKKALRVGASWYNKMSG